MLVGPTRRRPAGHASPQPAAAAQRGVAAVPRRGEGAAGVDVHGRHGRGAGHLDLGHAAEGTTDGSRVVDQECAQEWSIKNAHKDKKNFLSFKENDTKNFSAPDTPMSVRVAPDRGLLGVGAAGENVAGARAAAAGAGGARAGVVAAGKDGRRDRLGGNGLPAPRRFDRGSG